MPSITEIFPTFGPEYIDRFGEHHASLHYLPPYVFKVAISNSRIVKVHTVRYRKPDSARWRTMAVDALEFIRRFLQHMLPTGFMKIRYYGFMNPNSKVGLDTIRGLIELSYGFTVATPRSGDRALWEPMACKHCGGALKLQAIILASGVIVRPG